MLTSWLYAFWHHSDVNPDVVRYLRDVIQSWPRGTLLKDDESGDILIVNRTWPSTDTVTSLNAGVYLHCIGRRPRLLALGFTSPVTIDVSENDVVNIAERIRRAHEPDYNVPETEER